MNDTLYEVPRLTPLTPLQRRQAVALRVRRIGECGYHKCPYSPDCAEVEVIDDFGEVIGLSFNMDALTLTPKEV